MSHAVLVLQTERRILRDNHRHLRAGGEPHLSDFDRDELMAEILREIRDLDGAIFKLTGVLPIVRVYPLGRDSCAKAVVVAGSSAPNLIGC